MACWSIERWLAVAGLLLIQPVAVALHAQTGDSPEGPAVRLAAVGTDAGSDNAKAAADLADTDAYRLALLKIKGHLGVARSLLQLRASGADYHLQQPLRDIFAAVEPELEKRNAPLTSDVLMQLRRATEASPQAALAILDSVTGAVDGSFAQPGAIAPRSALALSEALLREAVGLYADAVVDNEVVDLRDYQTGRGFVVQAEALVRHSTGLTGEPRHDALLASVVLIRQSWPGVMPPPIVFDPASVRERLQQAVAAMDELR